MKKSGVRDPSSHRTPEQIKKQVRGYNHEPANIKKRSLRNAARAALMEKGVVRKGDSLDVDHRKPLRSGGGNSPGNLRAISRSRNRGWADGKT
jgi:hypothetical protein